MSHESLNVDKGFCAENHCAFDFVLPRILQHLFPIVHCGAEFFGKGQNCAFF